MNSLLQRLVKGPRGYELVSLVRCPKHRAADSPPDVIHEAAINLDCDLCLQEQHQEYLRLTEAQSWLGQIKSDDVVYLSGPMSGLPNHNREAFWLMEHVLKVSCRCRVNNPANHPDNMTYEWYMRQDIQMLLGSTKVVMLMGWQTSRGSTLEHQIANIIGLNIYEQS